MNYLRLLLLLLNGMILISCSTSTPEQQHVSLPSTDTQQVVNTKDTTENVTIKQPAESDCVFDTSMYKFTTEALRNYDPKLTYHWDDKEKQAIVPLAEHDTLLLHIGGCNHFSFWAEYHTDASYFSNEKYLMEKASWIAKNFFDNGFDRGFVKFISNKNYTLERNDGDVKSYSIITDSTVTEMEIYDGISIEKTGNRLKLGLHGYVN